MEGSEIRISNETWIMIANDGVGVKGPLDPGRVATAIPKRRATTNFIGLSRDSHVTRRNESIQFHHVLAVVFIFLLTFFFRPKQKDTECPFSLRDTNDVIDEIVTNGAKTVAGV